MMQIGGDESDGSDSNIHFSLFGDGEENEFVEALG
jgi:hypothetical protein